MATFVPPAIDGSGTLSIWWVPVLANPATPKLTELSATGSLPLACLLTRDGFGVTATQEKSVDDRICSKQTFQKLGKVTQEFTALKYPYDVQNPTSETNKAYATLVPGTSGYIVVRWTIDNDVAATVGNKVDVHFVTLGKQNKLMPEENGSHYASQELVQSGNSVYDVALVA